jgi:hypothetical protein
MLRYAVPIYNSNLYENLLKDFPHFALNLGLCTSPQVIHCHPKPNILMTIFLAQIGREFLQPYMEAENKSQSILPQKTVCKWHRCVLNLMTKCSFTPLNSLKKKDVCLIFSPILSFYIILHYNYYSFQKLVETDYIFSSLKL